MTTPQKNQGERLVALRMRLRVAESHLRYDPSEPTDHDRTIEQLEPLYELTKDLQRAIETNTSVEGESSCLLHDDPVFGRNNPPVPTRYLYHFTRVSTLSKIRKSRSLRFGPFSSMNDPHEALDIHPTSMGLISPGRSNISHRDPLVLTAEENSRFESTDWAEEINLARRSVAVGSFAMDIEPSLRDVSVDDVWPSAVARRLHGYRGFARPRMWAQYADDSRGVCLVFDAEQLIATHQAACLAAGLTGAHGPVNYVPAADGPGLGYIDIGVLLERGAFGVIVDNYREALLQKHEDWSGEAEFRFLVLDKSGDSFFLPISPDAVVGLIAGPKFDAQKHIRNIRAFARDFRLLHRVRKLAWTHGECELHLLHELFIPRR